MWAGSGGGGGGGMHMKVDHSIWFNFSVDHVYICMQTHNMAIHVLHASTREVLTDQSDVPVSVVHLH